MNLNDMFEGLEDDNFRKPAAMMKASPEALKQAKDIIQQQADKNVIGQAKITGAIPDQGVSEEGISRRELLKKGLAGTAGVAAGGSFARGGGGGGGHASSGGGHSSGGKGGSSGGKGGSAGIHGSEAPTNPFHPGSPYYPAVAGHGGGTQSSQVNDADKKEYIKFLTSYANAIRAGKMTPEMRKWLNNHPEVIEDLKRGKYGLTMGQLNADLLDIESRKNYHAMREESLNEFAVDGFGDSGDKRSKLLASVGRLLDSGNKVDWQVPGQMGHVTQVKPDGITMKRWKMPHSRKSYFLPMYDDSRDSKYTIKMVAPKHYTVVSAEQGVAEGSMTPNVTFAQSTPGSWARIDILVNGVKQFVAAKTVGPGFWSIFDLENENIGSGSNKSEIKSAVLDYLSRQGVAEGSDIPHWRVEQSDATGRYYVVSGYTNKSRRVWKSKLGAIDFVKKADAEAKAQELNQGVAEGEDDPWGPQGRYVGDTGPMQITTTAPRVQLKPGDRVLYKPTEQRARIEAMSSDGTKARIHIATPMGGKTFNCKTSDLKAIGQGVAEGSKIARANKLGKAPKPKNQQEYDAIEKYRKDLAQSYKPNKEQGVAEMETGITDIDNDIKSIDQGIQEDDFGTKPKRQRRQGSRHERGHEPDTENKLDEQVNQVEAYGYYYNKRDQRVMWRKVFPNTEAAYAWADMRNATVLGTRELMDENISESKKPSNRKVGLNENRMYYSTIGTPESDLRSEFNMRKDDNGWYLAENATRSQQLEALRAFGTPSTVNFMVEYDLSAFSGSTQTLGPDNVVSPVGSVPKTQKKKVKK